MNEKNDELIKRYIYDVTRRLPHSQRKDIEMELQSLIEDMLDNSATNTGDVSEILYKLGSPEELALKYRTEARHLIGEDYFEQYIFVLKIVLISVFTVTLFSNVIVDFAVITGIESFIEAVFSSFFGALSSTTAAFGTVTIIFAIIERANKKNTSESKAEWSIQDLPEIPKKEEIIKRSDIIVDLVFTIIFVAIIVFSPEVIGVWLSKGNETQVIQVFNLEVWNLVKPLFIGCFVLGVADKSVRFVVGKYGLIVSATTAVTNIVSYLILVITFKCFPILNPNFKSSLQEALNKTFNSPNDIMSYWGSGDFINIFLIVMFIITFAGIIETVYKGIRYSDTKLSDLFKLKVRQ